MDKVLSSITGGTTTYITPEQLLVKSNPFGNPNAKLTRDMTRLVLHSADAVADDSGNYRFNISWAPPLISGKRYMVQVESFAVTSTGDDAAELDAWVLRAGFNATNTYHSNAKSGAVLAVGFGNSYNGNQNIGAVYDAFGNVPLGAFEIQYRPIAVPDGDAIGAISFVLSLVFLPVD